MILSPLPGTPLITQGFGQNPDMYAQYGCAGHNGIDFGCGEGTTIYAPHDGVATVKDDKDKGYGLHIIIDAPTRRSVLAHLSQTKLKTGDNVMQGNPIAKSGRSGDVTGPHLHWTYKLLKNGAVQNKDNGYDGAMDVSECTRLWQEKDLRNNAEYTEDAKACLAMHLAESQVLRNPKAV